MQIKKRIGMVALFMLAGTVNVFASCPVFRNLGCAVATQLKVTGEATFCSGVTFTEPVTFCQSILGPGELVFTSSDIMFSKCTVLDDVELDFPPVLSPAMQTVYDFVYPCLSSVNGISQLRARPLFPSTDPDVSLLPTIDFKMPLDFDVTGWGIEVDAHILVARLVDGPLDDNNQVNIRMFMDWVGNALGQTDFGTCPDETSDTVVGAHCPLPVMKDLTFGVVEPCQPDGVSEFESQFRQYRITFCIPMEDFIGTQFPLFSPGDWARLIFARVVPGGTPSNEYEREVYLNVVSVRYPRKLIELPTTACQTS